ncbi:MAG: RluA family pseudouridine synthase [Acutalibacteraceae bacterium]
MIEILFENRDFAVCVKPAGVASQCDGADDLVKLLTEQLNTAVYPIHRLDTAVGGVMVFAKNKMSAASLSKEISERRFVKTYLAVAEGTPAEQEGRFEDLLFKDSRKNKSYVVKRERKGVRKVSLDYNVLAEADGKSLVKVRLNTGRSHQIRVQFASRKMPLAGDGKYGSKDNRCTVALWSAEIEFNFNKEKYNFESKPDFSVYPWNLFDF